MKLIIRPDVPQEVREALAGPWARWSHLLPTWCHELHVAFDADDSENNAKMEADMAYRRALLTLAPHWLVQDAQQRDDTVRHEFLHVPLTPLSLFWQDLLERLKGDDDTLVEWAREQWKEKYEGAVCDLEHALGDVGR